MIENLDEGCLGMRILLKLGYMNGRGIVRFFVLLIASCSSAGEPRFIVDQPNVQGMASVFFASEQDNGQYCIYEQMFANPVDLTVKDLDRSRAKLLTERSVSRADLISASLAELGDTGTVFNIGSYAIFPGGVTCALTGGSWVTIRKTRIGKVVGGIALLSCSLTGALFASATVVQNRAEQRLTVEVDNLLSTTAYRGTGDVKQTSRDVLSWLVSENSTPCNKQ